MLFRSLDAWSRTVVIPVVVVPVIGPVLVVARFLFNWLLSHFITILLFSVQ